ncbi:Rieske (2Fe-2S) protein [Jatrophihabitans sp. YIM 134969]
MTPSDLRDRPVTRRCALAGLGGVGAAAVLAACSSGGSDSGSDSGGGGTTAATSSAPATPASSAPGSASSAPTSAGGSPAGDAIASLSDIPVGGTASAQVNGETVLLSQPTAGQVEAFSPVCPHQGGQVKPDGGKFRCSLHFSEFDLDGGVTKGPAQSGLQSIAVSVSGDSVVEG